MMKSGSMLCLNKFYPEKDLKIVDIGQQKDKIVIRMKSISKTCSCPKCNCTTNKYHGMYHRKVQDLPILGKRVQLEIASHEYECINDEYSTHLVRSFRTFSAGHPEIQCNNSGCQCSPL